MSIFHKNSRKGYNIWEKFEIGSVILMAHANDKPKEDRID